MNKVIKLKKQSKTSDSDSIKQLNSKLNKLDKKIDNLYERLDGHINKIDKVKPEIKNTVNSKNKIYLSALTGMGINDLKTTINKLI